MFDLIRVRAKKKTATFTSAEVNLMLEVIDRARDGFRKLAPRDGTQPLFLSERVAQETLASMDFVSKRPIT